MLLRKNFLLCSNLFYVDNAEQFSYKQIVGASSPGYVTHRFPIMGA
jgi:hypothetical protein